MAPSVSDRASRRWRPDPLTHQVTLTPRSARCGPRSSTSRARRRARLAKDRKGQGDTYAGTPCRRRRTRPTATTCRARSRPLAQLVLVDGAGRRASRGPRAWGGWGGGCRPTPNCNTRRSFAEVPSTPLGPRERRRPAGEVTRRGLDQQHGPARGADHRTPRRSPRRLARSNGSDTQTKRGGAPPAGRLSAVFLQNQTKGQRRRRRERTTAMADAGRARRQPAAPGRGPRRRAQHGTPRVARPVKTASLAHHCFKIPLVVPRVEEGPVFRLVRGSVHDRVDALPAPLRHRAAHPVVPVSVGPLRVELRLPKLRGSSHRARGTTPAAAGHRVSMPGSRCRAHAGDE